MVHIQLAFYGNYVIHWYLITCICDYWRDEEARFTTLMVSTLDGERCKSEHLRSNST